MNRIIIIIGVLVIIGGLAIFAVSNKPEDSIVVQEIEEVAPPPPQETPVEIAEETSTDNFDITTANSFISGNQPLSLGDPEITLTDINDIKDNSQVALLTEQQEIKKITLAQLIEEANGELTVPVKVLLKGAIVEITLAELLEQYNNDLNKKIDVVRTIETLEFKSKEELQGKEILKVVSAPYYSSTTTIKDLLMDKHGDTTVYYVKNISEDDSQGLWGIIYNGLVKNFGEGIKIQQNEEIKTYQVTVPRHADELKEDLRSSYIGKIIDRKTADTYVFNYKKGRMGKSANIIHPGQEVIIVGFTPEELIDIHQYYSSRPTP